MKAKLLPLILIILSSCMPPQDVNEAGGLVFEIEILEQNIPQETIARNFEIIRDRIEKSSFNGMPKFIEDINAGKLRIELPAESDTAFFKTLILSKGEFRTSLTLNNHDIFTNLHKINELLAKENPGLILNPKITNDTDDSGKDDSAPGNANPLIDKMENMNGDTPTEFAINNPLFILLTPNLTNNYEGKLVPADNANIGFAEKSKHEIINRIFENKTIQKQLPEDFQAAWSFFSPTYYGDSNIFELYALSTKGASYQIKSEMIENAGTNYSKENRPVIDIILKKEFAATFAKLTRENIDKQLAIVVDDLVYSAPRVNDEIPSGRLQISGIYNKEQAQMLAIILSCGELNCEFLITKTEVIPAP